MKNKLISPALLGWATLGVLLLNLTSLRVAAADMKLEAQLIWGTDDAKSPDPKHKPVEPDVQKKLKELPLKWTHYFEVSRQRLDVPKAAAKKVALSEKCQIEVRNLNGSNVEVSLYGRGEHVWKRTQSLPKGEILVLGGNAPNCTAWLVTLKRSE